MEVAPAAPFSIRGLGGPFRLFGTTRLTLGRHPFGICGNLCGDLLNSHYGDGRQRLHDWGLNGIKGRRDVSVDFWHEVSSCMVASKLTSRLLPWPAPYTGCKELAASLPGVVAKGVISTLWPGAEGTRVTLQGTKALATEGSLVTGTKAPRTPAMGTQVPG